MRRLSLDRATKTVLRACQVAAVVAAGLTVTAGVASATPCLATPQCTLDGQTFTTTGGTSGNGLTFVANFTTPNQNNTTIADLVTDYLALSSINVTYLGRQDGSDLYPGIVSITTTPSTGGLTGTWTLNPGTTGFIGTYVAIHAGGGQTDNLFEINSPGLSGTWGTENDRGLSNFDLFGTKNSVPEPGALALFSFGLIALGLYSRRRRIRT